MKVLLISANQLKAPYPVYPLGLDYVKSALDNEHLVTIADMNLVGGRRELAAVIDECRPEIIGVSLRNVDNTDCSAPEGFVAQYRDLIAAIRRQSRAPIVLGGSGFTMFPAELLAALDADFGIVGEGERMVHLLAAITQGRHPGEVEGVVIRDRQPTVPPPWPQPAAPGPAQPREHLAYYLRHGGMLNLQTQRGCPFRCVYCTYPLIEGRRSRFVSAAAAAAKAMELVQAGARYIWITDSTFNAGTEHSLAVAEAFRDVGLTVPWGAFLTPGKPPQGYYQRLAQAGMTHVEFGTDALSDTILRHYRKPFRVRDVYAAHRAAVDAGLHVAHYLIFGGPGESEQTLNESLLNIDNLEKSVLFLFCGMRIYPRTELWAQAVEERQIHPDISLLDPVFYRPKAISAAAVSQRVRAATADRVNCVIGSGGAATQTIVSRMHAKGYSGPLWEYLVR